jgi:ABC-2 type transport system ATP-binding protein
MPVLTVTGAGVRHHRRWLFQDLDLVAEPGDLVAVAGVPGSGRTTVLLALARRFKLSAGKVDLSGTAALGHMPEVEQPEPVLTVAEHVRERLALLGRSGREAAAVELLGLDPALKGWQLTPYQKQLLGLVLAGMAMPAVIVLDGVDDGLDLAEQAELWRILGEIAARGVAVIVSVREIDPARVTTVIHLADPQAHPAPPETDAATAAPAMPDAAAEEARRAGADDEPGSGADDEPGAGAEEPPPASVEEKAAAGVEEGRESDVDPEPGVVERAKPAEEAGASVSPDNGESSNRGEQPAGPGGMSGVADQGTTGEEK